ncbi:CpaF family protein [Vibrio mediterranei]|uniref:CpaF family protein n=1 Tax=Vibrio mediterranei TaxID=689 RepID=UPI004068CD50
MFDTLKTLFGDVPIAKQYEWQWVEKHFQPIADLYQTPDVTEIFVDRFDTIAIERNGAIEKTDCRFDSEKSFQALLTQLALCLNQTLTEESPILDARLPDCSRICATLPAVTPQGASMTLRIAPTNHISAEQLVEFGALSAPMLTYLIEAIQSGKNIIVSGNTGSGKTTLLRALARYIPLKERIVVCEDTQELYLDWLPFLISMESPKRSSSDVEMKTLIETSLRMRPDRIWVGEIRNGRAADAFLQAINTGHSGCMTTVHANGCDDALSRLQYLIASQGNISFDLAYQQIVGNVDIFVHASRHESYGRKVTEIAEVVNGTLTPKFMFDQQDHHHIAANTHIGT